MRKMILMTITMIHLRMIMTIDSDSISRMIMTIDSNSLSRMNMIIDSDSFWEMTY